MLMTDDFDEIKSEIVMIWNRKVKVHHSHFKATQLLSQTSVSQSDFSGECIGESKQISDASRSLTKEKVHHREQVEPPQVSSEHIQRTADISTRHSISRNFNLLLFI